MAFNDLWHFFFSCPVAAAARAQVQQEPAADTTEGTGISVTCSHPSIQSHQIIYWYRRLPGQAPTFLAGALQGSQELRSAAGRLSVAADRRSSTLWLARPRLGDAAVYSCALGDTGGEAEAASGHEPPRVGQGRGDSPGRGRQGALPTPRASALGPGGITAAAGCSQQRLQVPLRGKRQQVLAGRSLQMQEPMESPWLEEASEVIKSAQELTLPGPLLRRGLSTMSRWLPVHPRTQLLPWAACARL